MRSRNWLAGAALGAFLTADFLTHGAGANPLPMDTPIMLDTVEAVCTGIGEGKDDPRWKTYPIRVEFTNAAAQYIAGAHVTLADAAGRSLAEFDCPGSWVLFKLTPGLYGVSATINGVTAGQRSAKFQTPQTGQKRVVLEFSDIPASN